MRNSSAGYDPGCANRSRSDADFYRISSRFDQSAGAIKRPNVAGEELYFRQLALDLPHGIEHSSGVPVRAVDGNYIHFVARHLLRTFKIVASGSDGCPDSQAPLRILRGVRVFQFLLNVFYRDQPLQSLLVVDDQQLLHPVLVQDLFSLFERGTDGDGDEIVFGHHLCNRNVSARLKAEIAVSQNADQLSVFRNRHAGDLELSHYFERI